MMGPDLAVRTNAIILRNAEYHAGGILFDRIEMFRLPLLFPRAATFDSPPKKLTAQTREIPSKNLVILVAF